jgi:hypothetical protein
LRRAISSAYYSLFHHAMTCLADEFVGASQRGTSRYVLVYRSVDHRTLKDLCGRVLHHGASARYSRHVPAAGFGGHLQAFAMVATELQEKRLEANYDPAPRFKTADAKIAIEAARSAIARFGGAQQDQRKAFLTLLLCPPR